MEAQRRHRLPTPKAIKENEMGLRGEPRAAHASALAPGNVSNRIYLKEMEDTIAYRE